MLARVFFRTLYSVLEPRRAVRSSPSSETLSPRYSVSNAATESSRRPLIASTSATLLAFGTGILLALKLGATKKTVRVGPPVTLASRQPYRAACEPERNLMYEP